jgi:hypothetical protein
LSWTFSSFLHIQFHVHSHFRSEDQGCHSSNATTKVRVKRMGAKSDMYVYDCGTYHFGMLWQFLWVPYFWKMIWHCSSSIEYWSFFSCPIWLPVYFLFFSIMNPNWVQKLTLGWLWHHVHLASRTEIEPTTFRSWAECSTARPQLSLIEVSSSFESIYINPVILLSLAWLKWGGEKWLC